MASLELKLLGGFSARLGSGQPIEIAGKKNQALLAYLALNKGKKISREKLVALLWSDRGEVQGRNSLRQALVALKEALSGMDRSPLVLDGDHVALDPARATSDAVQFRALAKSNSATDLRQAAQLYEGQLLDGISVRDPAFEEWLSVERAQFQENATATLGKAADQSQGAEAVSLAQRAVGLDPLREASHRALMRAYAGIGEKTLALQAYAACRNLLNAELGVEPAGATEELRQRILDEQPSVIAPQQQKEPILPPQRVISLAVLPFSNMSGDPEQSYFSDGITEDIITELSRYRGLRVAARSSSFQYRDKSLDTRRAGQELGVDYLVEGSIRKVGNRVRITAQLIEAGSGNHLWAERYDRAVEQIFEIQDEVVRAIATAIPGEVERSHYDAARSKRGENLTAYDYVLRARWHQWHATPDQQEAVNLFRKALEIDPDCLPAHQGLARQYTYEIHTMAVPQDEAMAKARYHVERALAIDDRDAATFAAAAVCYLFCGELELASTYANRAFSINPNDVKVLRVYAGVVLYSDGDCAAAEYLMLKARQLSPHTPDEYWLELLFDCHYMAGEFDKAVETFRKTPDPIPHMYAEYAAALAQLNRLEEARSAMTMSQQRSPAGWEAAKFALGLSRMCKRKEHAMLWIDGFRKAGVSF